MRASCGVMFIWHLRPHYAVGLSCRQRRGRRKKDPPRWPESFMNVRLPGARWVARAALTAVLLAPLAGCGRARNQFAPVCPNQAILGDAANLNVYRPSATQGPARDLTDLVVSGRIVSIHGTCQPGSNSRQLNVAVAVNVELTRGPAIQGSGVTIPLF